MRAPAKHNLRVEKICEEIKQWCCSVDRGSRKLCSARPGWQAMSLRSGKYKGFFQCVSLNLHDILEVNESLGYCRLEPMVTMGQLTRSLIPLGWTLPVLPELDDLTVGGLMAGVGIESSSHK